MKVLVLGGCGIQGRAALYDLSRNDYASKVTCADIHPEIIHTFEYIDASKIQGTQVDANDKNALVSIMSDGYDIVLDFLPPKFIKIVAEAAVKSGVSLVNTNYAYDILKLDERARAKGISIVPECGLDPGIDLVIYNYGIKHFDEVYKLNSYCGGIPEKKACDNPLKYKISWNWDAVLKSQIRDATLIKERKVINISGENQHDNEYIHLIDFPGLGKLEAFPNGNAVHFTDLLKITPKIIETGRYSLRWPGWCEFWRTLKHFGFLNDTPVTGLPSNVSPYELVAKLIEPQIQYKNDEKDLAVMLNKFEGLKDGKKKIMTFSILIERDLNTGLMAMSLGVGYSACIVAEMIAKGEIAEKGILSPVKDVPADSFINELKRRGIKIEEMVD